MSIRKAATRSMVRRILKPFPLIGAVAVAALAFGSLRRKGVLKGGADVLLDMVPVVGLAKGIVETFTGDLLPDKKA